jgi:hypothetical protein
MRKTPLVLAALLILALLAAGALASVTFTPPDTKQVKLATVVLHAEKTAGQAAGTASLVCKPDLSKGTLTIQASGLDPKKVYTVWLITPPPPQKMAKAGTPAPKMDKMGPDHNMAGKMQMMGLGRAPYKLTVDAKGKVNFAVAVKDCGKIVKQKLEIAEHPDKDAKNLKNIVPVLTAELTKMQDEKPKMK